MPELPEVETMVRGLRPALDGAKIRDVTVFDPKLIHGISPEDFERRCAGAGVVGVGRRGKWVVIELAGMLGIIVIQPRMTGGFWLLPPDKPAHVRLSFRLDGPCPEIWYCDARRLGRAAWFSGPEEANRAFARSHGPDALEIVRPDLASRLEKTQRGIKATLMDQKVLAGIGNIYADEILHRAKLHPSRPAAGLNSREVGRLHAAIQPILREAIAAEGSSFDAGYRTVLGLEGGFLSQNAVHRRKGQPCPFCQTPIIKTRIAGLIGRPTYLCSVCQPEPSTP